MKKVGLIGAGNIGQFLLQQQLPGLAITQVFVRSAEKAQQIQSIDGVQVETDFAAFLAADVDLVVEAATVEAVQQYALPVLERGKDLLVISVGAFVNSSLVRACQTACERHGASLYLPAGAIGGLDVLKAAKVLDGLHSVSLTTRKPPQALLDEPLTEERVLFEGSAKEAIVRFPKNINVAIILSLAGIGVEQTRVRIIADPAVTRNTHTIEARGDFGRMTLTVENDPMPRNPKTSYLAALSALASLQESQSVLKIG